MVPLDDWYGAGRWFDYRGHRIWIRDSATTDPCLILIHGFPTASWDWHAVWPALFAEYRLVTLDLIGFGWSDKPRRYDYSLFDQADLVEALADHLGIRSAHLLAHDYGDTVAQELLARAVDGEGSFQIGRCVLLNGGIIPGTHRPTRVQKLLALPLGGAVSLLLNERGFRRAFCGIFGSDTHPSEAELEAYWALIRRNGGRRIMHRLIRYMAERDRNSDRWVGALRDCPVPLRFINGLADPVSGAHVVQAFRDRVVDPDVVELAGIGHYPQVEAPGPVARAVLEFLRAGTG